MSREEKVNYKQDRLGNEKKELDEYRAQSGNVQGSGLVTLDTANPVVVMKIPDDSEGVHLEQVDVHNSGTAAGTVQLYSVELDDSDNIVSDDLDGSGNIADENKRSVPYSVAGESTRTIGYTGKGFDEDAIAVESTADGEIGVGVYPMREEAVEPNSTQTATPSE